MENKFCNFLLNIGLIDLKTSKILKEINHGIINSRNIHNFSDCFFISLIHYFNNLTLNQKKYICFNLPLRFLLNKEKEKKRKMRLIILKKQLKEKSLKLKYLLTWIRHNKSKRKALTKQKSGDSLLNNRITFDDFINRKKEIEYKMNYKNNNINIDINNNNIIKIKNFKIRKNNSFNKSNIYNYYTNKTNDIINSKDIITTTDKLELLQLSECTFKPSINTTNNSFRNTNLNSDFQSTFEKLYKDSEKYRIKKSLRAIEYENIINKDLTFRPSISQTPKIISNFKFDDFETRQKNFIDNKVNNANKLKKNLERNAERKCSFSPKINKIIDFTSTSFNNNKTNEENKNINTNNNNCDSYYSISTVKTIPAHVRLYNDSKRRNSSYIQKEIEYKNLIEELASRTSKKFSKVNYSKLNKLHEYKEKKIILEKTKKKVEKEEGITFKPELHLNNKYTDRIFSDFYDRNKNFKKNKIFENYDKFQDNKIDKKYSEDEKKQIIQNIVKRLYKEPMTQKLFHNNECNKYIKNNNSSRSNIQKQNSENKEN